jgi:hypothetical protein
MSIHFHLGFGILVQFNSMPTFYASKHNVKLGMELEFGSGAVKFKLHILGQ